MTTSRQSIAASNWKAAERPFDVWEIRKDFPILRQKVHGKPLVYFDNAATSQKPQIVIDTILRYYTTENSNIHRGIHQLSEQATKDYEDARRLMIYAFASEIIGQIKVAKLRTWLEETLRSRI